MKVEKYRKKPVVIEAIEFKGKENWSEVNTFIGDSFVSIAENDDGTATLGLKTLEGTLYGFQGDFIIRGVKGEIYACKPDIFALTYEKAGE